MVVSSAAYREVQPASGELDKVDTKYFWPSDLITTTWLSLQKFFPILNDKFKFKFSTNT